MLGYGSCVGVGGRICGSKVVPPVGRGSRLVGEWPSDGAFCGGGGRSGGERRGGESWTGERRGGERGCPGERDDIAKRFPRPSFWSSFIRRDAARAYQVCQLDP